jgi:dipeptidyl aminopeptidase/acylaminoacyl peptidase
LIFTLSSNFEGGEIYTMNADGGSAQRLFSHVGWNDIEPEWSPDGRYVAFAAGVHRGAATRHDIWIYDTVRRVGGTVAQHPSWNLRRPAWSPDGRYLVFAAEYDLSPPRWALYVVPALGGAVSGPLSNGFEPDWASPFALPSPTVVPFPSATMLTPPPPPPFPTIPPPEPTLPGPTPTEIPPPTFEPPTEVSEPTPTTRPTDIGRNFRLFVPVTANQAPVGLR